MNQTESLYDRATAAYIGLAIGDALGATVEFMTPDEIKLKYGLHDEIVGGGWLSLKPGAVTDDTTMSLALGNSILSEQAIVPQAIAQAFSDWLKAKPVDVGHTVRKGIVHFRYGGVPITPFCEFDSGNGACMRTLPIALSTLFKPEADVRMASRDQAHTTHNSELSDAGTECIVLMIQDSLLKTNKSALTQKWVNPLIQKHPIYSFENSKRKDPSGFIVDTLQAVFQSFFDLTSFEDSLIDVVNRGGDADTTGAILGMLAGAYYGMSAIPEKWINGLDPNIKNACIEQAKQLVDYALTTRNSLEKSSLVAHG